MTPPVLITVIVSGCADLLKAAPILDELRRRLPEWHVRLIYTGRQSDEQLPASAFEELAIAQPDRCLEVARGERLSETTGIMLALHKEFCASRPDAVMVFGDAPASLAGALASSLLGIRVARVEAGLRSFDRRAPAEMHRVLSDAAADWLFTTERDADANLQAEGFPHRRVHLAGSTLVDMLMRHRTAGAHLRFGLELGLQDPYAVVALSKPENVDDLLQRRSIAFALLTLADEFDVVCTVSRHAIDRLRTTDVHEMVADHHRLRVLPGVGYVEFISLLNDARAVLTDSNGVQEEALVIGTPCVTLNRYTTHPITLAHGGNRLAGDDPHLAVRYVREAIRSRAGFAPIPEGWDGHAAARIVDVIERDLTPEGSGALAAGSDDRF